jgi:hypothetical protein
MRNPWIATACLVLIGCAAQTTAPDLNQTENALPPALTEDSRVDAAPEKSDAAPQQSAREVSIESFAGVATCRRYVATGTRIAGKRCASDGPTEMDRIEHEQVRRDLEAMRRQQVYQEQARQQAEALRRRTER